MIKNIHKYSQYISLSYLFNFIIEIQPAKIGIAINKIRILTLYYQIVH